MLYYKYSNKTRKLFDISLLTRQTLKSLVNVKKKSRTWRKPHLAIDVDTREAISTEASLVNVGDIEVQILSRANHNENRKQVG